MKTFKIGLLSLVLSVIFVLLISFYNSKPNTNSTDFTKINYAEEVDSELKPYLDKFLRDLNNFEIIYDIPKTIILKLKNLDKKELTRHSHAISLGFNQNDLVEIYINTDSWNSFNKTQKYYVIYHELCHDILNLDDLIESDRNYGQIMYPKISKYDNLKMNDFITNLNELFSSL
jgi:hypothetical protein